MARCHIANAGAIALTLVIREFMESGKSMARHFHEFGCEGGWRQHPLEPPSARIHEGHEAAREPMCGVYGAENTVHPDNQWEIVNRE